MVAGNNTYYYLWSRYRFRFTLYIVIDYRFGAYFVLWGLTGARAARAGRPGAGL